MLGYILPFFNDGGAQDTSAADVIAATLIGSGGTMLMLIAQKQLIGVRKTRNTAGLSEKFMFWQCITCVFLSITSIFGIVGSAPIQLWKWVVIDGLLVLMNCYLFYSNFFTYKIKKANMEAAQKAKMSEGEYYEKVIAPTLHLTKQLKPTKTKKTKTKSK